MKRTMRLWDIVLMNVTAIIGLRWLPIAAGYGASSILLWILAGTLFFIPLGLVSAELATAWPDQGGLYVWIRKAFGDRLGFLTSWFYWISNLFYYPALLTFIAVTLAFITRPEWALDKRFVCLVIIGVFWAVTLVNCKGLSLGKWLTSVSGTFGTLLPGLILIALGLLSVFCWHRPIPTDYAAAKWLPSFSTSNLAFLSTLMFAMAGIELTPIFAGETEAPQKTFPRATVISALLIVGTYILGTAAMTWLVDPSKIGASSGIMESIKLVADDLRFPWVTVAVGWMMIIGGFGGASLWVLGPIKMLFESLQDDVLPPSFTRLNEEGAPQNAMLIQAVLITFIVLGTSLLPTVDRIYQVLILMTTITYFLPYLLMFAAFLRLREQYPSVPRPYRVPGGKLSARTVAFVGISSVVLAIVLAFVPPADVRTTAELLVYEGAIAGGPLLLGVLGFWLYRRHELALAA
ncbi:MAG: APC family permease [Bacteroidota bacterium]